MQPTTLYLSWLRGYPTLNQWISRIQISANACSIKTDSDSLQRLSLVQWRGSPVHYSNCKWWNIYWNLPSDALPPAGLMATERKPVEMVPLRPSTVHSWQYYSRRLNNIFHSCAIKLIKLNSNWNEACLDIYTQKQNKSSTTWFKRGGERLVPIKTLEVRKCAVKANTTVVLYYVQLT